MPMTFRTACQQRVRRDGGARSQRSHRPGELAAGKPSGMASASEISNSESSGEKMFRNEKDMAVGPMKDGSYKIHRLENQLERSGFHFMVILKKAD